MPPTVRQLLHESVDRLRNAGVDTPKLDADVMLSKASGRSRLDLFAHPEFVPPEAEVRQFLEWVERRVKREPLAYIIGEREFYGISFEVTPDVLIPRPDTEILVETAIGLIHGMQAPTVVDIGLGSGAIAISIAANVSDAIVYGSEFSHAALSIACRNAQRAGVSGRTHFSLGDLFEPFKGLRFDLIVSNPPYIPTSEIDSLEPEVAVYEPRQALDGGPDGLDYYRRLTSMACRYLMPGGALALEVGIGESGAVEELLASNGFKAIRSVRDYSGIDRVVCGRKGDCNADHCS